jgi:hypothetical protein
MFSSARVRVASLGVAIWLGGTLLIRILGERLLHPDAVVQTLVLYAVSFAAMALVAARLFRKLRVDPIEGVTLLALPTLVLDPFSCLFFASVFPNVAPAAAGVFGGWMLICCGGAVAGAWAFR